MKMNENTLYIEIKDLPSMGESLARELKTDGMMSARRIAADVHHTLETEKILLPEA